MAEPGRPLTSLLNAKARQANIPLSGTFELSPVCNLACKMCYVRRSAAEVASHTRPILTCETWKRIADEAFDRGLLFLLLTGGEPFLWPDFPTLYRHLIRKGLVLSINSNGTLIDRQAVRFLREAPPSRINITLYGASDETYRRLCGAQGKFRQVTENIDLLLENGIPVKLNCSLTPENAADLEAIVRFAQERDLLLDVGTYMFPPIRRNSESVCADYRFTPRSAAFYQLEHMRLIATPEEYRRYLEQAVEGSVPPPGPNESCFDPTDGQVRCQAGRASFWITWDGLMTPCGMMPEPGADVTALGFDEAWRQTVQSTRNMSLSGVCQGCKNQFLCHCCASMAVAETGGPSGIPRYLCQMAQELRAQAAAALAGL